ncbi:MAG: four helix bundle protein [Chloroflexota bacterium]|nr:four helix bundle protein [Chloroflexota bacterium]
MQDYRKLKVWAKSHELTLAVYRATQSFPQHEAYRLTSQMRRCSSSIPSNIVEGCGRGSNPDFLRFLYVALGSANELEYQLLLAHDLGYIADALHLELSAGSLEVKRMLSALIVTLKTSKRTVREPLPPPEEL